MDKEFLHYFIERTDERFDKLESKLDMLIKFKWQIIGGSVTASVFVACMVQLVLWKVN